MMWTDSQITERMPQGSKRNYKFTKLKEKINHLIYMNDIKLVAENEKELETLRI